MRWVGGLMPGRTGKMQAFEHAGVFPDVLVLSKAMGSGMPPAVIL